MEKTKYMRIIAYMQDNTHKLYFEQFAGCGILISFEPLFRTMKEKGISSYRLAKMGFPLSNYHAIRRGRNVSTHTIDTLCSILDCDVSDVMEFRRECPSNPEEK